MTEDEFTSEDKMRVLRRLRLQFARAHAIEERRQAGGAGAALSVSFLPRAAQAGEIRLSRGMIADDDPLVMIDFEPDSTGIAVTVSAIGAARAEELADKEARLVSNNGKVDYAFRFDAIGVARFRLSGDPQTTGSLTGGFQVLHDG